MLKQAKDKGITVIAYDRLIRDTPNVDYYATFDNFQVGVLQAQSIEQGLGLKEGKGPFNIELFGGSPDDNNAYFFYNGAMSVLQPYIDSGKLVVVSNQMGMDKVSTLRWDGATAQARMDNLLSAFYSNKRVDAVLSPYDGLSIGIMSSLKGVGYGSGNSRCRSSAARMRKCRRSSRCCAASSTPPIFKDTRDLAKVTVDMVDAALSGKTVTVNDTKTYNNGVKVVPSYLLKPVVVDKSQLGEGPDRRRLLQEGAVQLRSVAGVVAQRRSAAVGSPVPGIPMTAHCSKCAASARAFAGVKALNDVNFTVEAGRDPCPRRRERRRQVDADEGAERRLSPRQL